MVRQTADVLRRFGALEQPDFEKAQALGRDMRLLEVVGRWFKARRRASARGGRPAPVDDE